MNWTAIIIAVGLVAIGISAVCGACLCRDNAVEFTAMLGVTSSVVSGAIGWLAKSPISNGNGSKP